jgi:hypothetical protein
MKHLCHSHTIHNTQCEYNEYKTQNSINNKRGDEQQNAGMSMKTPEWPGKRRDGQQHAGMNSKST